jgi:hypothetical protein
MDELIALKLHDIDGRDLDHASGRWYPGQKPINLRGVSKVHDEFIHNRVWADGAAHGRKPEIGWVYPDEMILVKTLELIVPDTSGHRARSRRWNYWNT